MRLINVRTRLFEEVLGEIKPKYAILSHTWEKGEVSFTDMNDLSCKDKKGYGKIEMTCQMALKAALNYAWVDTCCIDKSSSAELTEAINSMYRWYQRSDICFVFLSDLKASSSLDRGLEGCRWFKRGWTLQELIAPKNIYFFDQDWNKRGPNDRVFCGILAKSPIAFASCGSFEKTVDYRPQEFSVSNIGVKTQAKILSKPIMGKGHGTCYILPLACSCAPQQSSLGVRLRKCGSDQFIREDPWTLIEDTENLLPNCTRQRYLLTGLPEINLYPDSQTLDMSLLIAQTRSNVLQIRLPANIDIHDAWPWDRFDDEDQLFFVSGEPRKDSASMRLRVDFPTQVRRRKTTAEFECVFYAIGWSELETSSLQCTLVDYRSFTTKLNEVQSEITGWGHDRRLVLEDLAFHEIPKCSSAALKIQGTEKSALVSFTPVLVSDPRICRNSFWRIEFSCDLCETNKLPQIQEEGWDL
ncbi:hypothetical protein OIDMADRAFT_51035 [Oidiodendron maius Zn]|uniref:Heterokaryon incompatibility domain-containing protein n=1 Tax=Oidiodendron maius (strain Zn) TaxID=913774 RepID=A0A0C3DT16_OIDMZ|nr:hypothetical protein OIDMADRAFT_51035 [Oidiodendron maius Zn]